MRGALKYGVPIAGGLATGGYALSQGEDPGSAVLAGLAGGAGAAGGLLGARMAGKYAPEIARMAQERVITPAANIVGDIGAKIPKESKVRNKAIGQVADVLAAAEQSAMGPGAQRMVGKIAAGMGVPAAAGLAGLGGTAIANAIPPLDSTAYGAMLGGTAGTVLGGIPGGLIGGTGGAILGSQYNQNVITDPELAGSSNTQMARMSTPTLRYIG
jgi:hypothetical protein